MLFKFSQGEFVFLPSLKQEVYQYTVCPGCILSLCLFNLYAEYIIQNPHWMTHKLESRLPNNFR